MTLRLCLRAYDLTLEEEVRSVRKRTHAAAAYALEEEVLASNSVLEFTKCAVLHGIR
jgi:hypothetical protein